MKATEAQLDYIRGLGGTPPPGLGISEAHLLIEELLAKSPVPSMQPATKKQLQFIRELGGDVPPGLTKKDAAKLIPQLLTKQHKSQPSQQSPTPQRIISWDEIRARSALPVFQQPPTPQQAAADSLLRWQTEQKSPRYVTCRCQHCNGHIEFDANELVEESVVVPCPHCDLETKIFIPDSQPEKVSTDMSSSVASPNTARREGFFCGGDEPSPIEQPANVVSREWQFTIVANIQQGTDTWREWRHNGIGASEASTIMGENRFKSYSQLLQEKRGPACDVGQNAAMARGTELEPEARNLYIAETGKNVRPACLQSTRYDWLRASVDGIAVSGDAVVEIKCGQSAYRTAKQTRSVPDYYYGQMQHILAVTGFDSLDFWCYWPGNAPLLIPVARNISYIERLLNKELEFWNLIQRAS
jgi:putative phage-type endonuclease